ncbi:MAG: glycosyltransferase family 2 protein [Solirubrobacterales bacterium]|nr:glycosyltransferase family 2 protein [Solirubrobacterales bacterium]
MNDTPSYDTQAEELTAAQPATLAPSGPGRLTATTASSTEVSVTSLPAEEQGPAAAFLAAHPAGAGAPVAIVIPAYNEEPTVADVVASIPSEMAGLATEIIVVVDGSTDATAAKAAEAGALVCNIPINRGQGLVFKLGYWLARARGAEIIATIDADGQYIESELERLVEPIVAGRADFVNGSRRLGTELTTDPVRHAGVIFFGKLVSILLRQPITDPACGLRAMRVKVSETVKLEQTQYQSSELLIATAMNGFRVIEVATTMRDRPVGATGTKKGPNLLYGMRFARAVLGTWRRERKAARTRLRSEKIQYS